MILKDLGLRVDRTRIRRQLNAGYNIVTLQDKESSQQADFIIQSSGGLERRPGSLLGLRTFYQTPESLILAKLRMIKITRPRERSLKDREDIRAILRNTEVNISKVIKAAKRETTIDLARVLLLKPPRSSPTRVKAKGRWGKETFPDAGEATFGD